MHLYGVLLNNWRTMDVSTHFQHVPLSADFKCGRLAALQSQDGVDSERVIFVCSTITKLCQLQQSRESFEVNVSKSHQYEA
jgi:hypothetical protein